VERLTQGSWQRKVRSGANRAKKAAKVAVATPDRTAKRASKPKRSARKRVGPLQAKPTSLGFDLGYRIVSLAVSEATAYDTLTPDVTIDQVLPLTEQRGVFEQALRNHLKGFTNSSIEPFPKRGRTTVNMLAKMVGSLPGDSRT
jgi:hypothetical protein